MRLVAVQSTWLDAESTVHVDELHPLHGDRNRCRLSAAFAQNLESERMHAIIELNWIHRVRQKKRQERERAEQTKRVENMQRAWRLGCLIREIIFFHIETIDGMNGGSWNESKWKKEICRPSAHRMQHPERSVRPHKNVQCAHMLLQRHAFRLAESSTYYYAIVGGALPRL